MRPVANIVSAVGVSVYPALDLDPRLEAYNSRCSELNSMPLSNMAILIFLLFEILTLRNCLARERTSSWYSNHSFVLLVLNNVEF